MIRIAAPYTATHYPDRILDCEAALAPAFQFLARQAEVLGWKGDEIAAALANLADNHLLACPAEAVPALCLADPSRVAC